MVMERERDGVDGGREMREAEDGETKRRESRKGRGKGKQGGCYIHCIESS